MYAFEAKPSDRCFRWFWPLCWCLSKWTPTRRLHTKLCKIGRWLESWWGSLHIYLLTYHWFWTLFIHIYLILIFDDVTMKTSNRTSKLNVPSRRHRVCIVLRTFTLVLTLCLLICTSVSYVCNFSFCWKSWIEQFDLIFLYLVSLFSSRYRVRSSTISRRRRLLLIFEHFWCLLCCFSFIP